MQEQWTLLISEMILYTFTYTSKQGSLTLSHFLHGTWHISLQSLCDIWVWGDISEKNINIHSYYASKGEGLTEIITHKI